MVEVKGISMNERVMFDMHPYDDACDVHLPLQVSELGMITDAKPTSTVAAVVAQGYG